MAGLTDLEDELMERLEETIAKLARADCEITDLVIEAHRQKKRVQALQRSIRSQIHKVEDEKQHAAAALANIDAILDNFQRAR